MEKITQETSVEKKNDLSTEEEEMCMKVVMENGCNIKYIINQTPELCLRAVENNRDALKYIRDEANVKFVLEKLYGII